MSDALDSAKRDEHALRNMLKEADAIFKTKYTYLCPFHNNTDTESGSLYEDGGIWFFKCHNPVCNAHGTIVDATLRARGGTPASVIQSINGAARPMALTPLKSPQIAPLETRKLPSLPQLPPRADTPSAKTAYPTIEKAVEWMAGKGLRVEEIYRYTDPDVSGKVDLYVVRVWDTEKGVKGFRQATPCEGGVQFSGGGDGLPIYNRKGVQKCASVLVVEGEKCVHKVTPFLPTGWAATTSAGGAGKARLTDWAPLSGKRVVLWPDNDPVKKGVSVGVEHMKDVMEILQKLSPAPDVSMISPDGLDIPEKGDVCDWIEIRKTPDDYGNVPTDSTITQCLVTELYGGEVKSASDPLLRRIMGCITGELLAKPFAHWPLVSKLSQCTIPKTVFLVCGDPGSGKSYWLLQAMMGWHFAGEKVAIYELEEDDECWQHRAWTLFNSDSKLADREWIHKHPEEALNLYNASKPQMDSFVSRIFSKADRDERYPTQLDVVEWAKARGEEGCRIIGIDPATAALGGNSPWTSDLEFMLNLLNIAKRYSMTIGIVTHPSKAAGAKPGLHTLAGGAAYSRFSQSALWISGEDNKPTAKMVVRNGEIVPREGNRKLLIIKARHGRGTGAKLWYNFNPATLSFEEQGNLQNDQITPKSSGEYDKP